MTQTKDSAPKRGFLSKLNRKQSLVDNAIENDYTLLHITGTFIGFARDEAHYGHVTVKTIWGRPLFPRVKVEQLTRTEFAQRYPAASKKFGKSDI